MSAERVPTMSRLRDDYLRLRQEGHYGFADLYSEEWDRALATHDAQVRAKVARPIEARLAEVADVAEDRAATVQELRDELTQVRAEVAEQIAQAIEAEVYTVNPEGVPELVALTIKQRTARIAREHGGERT